MKETAEWRELVAAADFDSFSVEVRQRYDAIVLSDSPNEAVTEQEVIRPVLEALGWSDYLPPAGIVGKRGHPRPSAVL